MKTQWKGVLPRLKRSSSKPARKNLPKSTFSIQVKCLFVCICGKYGNTKGVWSSQTFRIATVFTKVYHQVITGHVYMGDCSGLITDVELKPWFLNGGRMKGRQFHCFVIASCWTLKMLLNLSGSLHIEHCFSAYPWWQSTVLVLGISAKLPRRCSQSFCWTSYPGLAYVWSLVCPDVFNRFLGI